jgi:anti-anti-sigma factor
VSEIDHYPHAGAAAACQPSVDVAFRPSRASGYAAVVELGGEHDLATSTAILAALAPLSGDVLVDLSECVFIDSVVIGVLLDKQRELEREGYRLELVLPPERVQLARIVEVVGLRNLLTVHERLPAHGAPVTERGH